ncbi:MAG: NADH:flavin oxidoreductase/NADH oxidase [Desulfuromonadales bacterium]|nr:NADH:flavin oxidoreductase/NADH oxidase [Desulfuromonadales bacterium]
MSALFSTWSSRALTLKNRICLSPMCQYSCTDGLVNDWHLVHLGSRAAGGAALVMTEATAVLPEGRISPADCGLWNDEQAAALSPIVRFISERGAVPAIQLGHAGRKASVSPPWRGGIPVPAAAGGWQPLAPSPIPFSPSAVTPTELTGNQLEQIAEAFVAAAGRALRAGFRVVEVHMAHGYLLHEFLSPLTNQRTDNFGGSLNNRLRFPLEVAQRVRATWPEDLPVFVRISATDWIEGGWDLAQSLELCRQLRRLGIDLIDCSSGGLTPDAVIPAAPGFQTPFAATVRREVDIATGAVGLITAAEQAEQIIATGVADLVLLGRELLRNPHWPLDAARILKAEHLWPVQYERARI